VVLACGAGAVYLVQSSFWWVTADIGGASAGSVSGIMNMGGQIGDDGFVDAVHCRALRMDGVILGSGGIVRDGSGGVAGGGDLT